MIPREWHYTSVQEACELVSVGIVIRPAQYYVDAGAGVRAFRSANIGKGYVRNDDWVYISHDGNAKNSKSQLKTGDVLIVRSGNAGVACVVSEEYGGSNCIDIVFARPKKDILLPEYLCEITNSEAGRRQIERAQGGLGLKHLNVGAYSEFDIPCPPIDEQRGIIGIAAKWDRAIDLAEQLIAEKKERRKGLMQQLLTGKGRLPGFEGEWEERPLRALTTECKARNRGKHGREDVRAVTKAAGMVPMKDHVMADNLDRYKIVAKNWFAYNPMRINVGSICMWRGHSDVVVSPDYVVFRCKEGKLDPEYLEFLRQTHRWQHYMDVAGSGGVRVRIYYDDLASLHFKFPPFAEQQAIARVLGAATREIDLLQTKASALREQKKGLMQQLLTGRVRVRV